MRFHDLEARGRPLAGRAMNLRVLNPTQASASGVFQVNITVSTFQRLVNTIETPKGHSRAPSQIVNASDPSVVITLSNAILG